MQEIIKKLKEDLLEYALMNRSNKISVEICDPPEIIASCKEKIAIIKRFNLYDFEIRAVQDNKYPIEINLFKKPINSKLTISPILLLDKNYIIKVKDNDDLNIYHNIITSINTINNTTVSGTMKLANIIEMFYAIPDSSKIENTEDIMIYTRKEIFEID